MGSISFATAAPGGVRALRVAVLASLEWEFRATCSTEDRGSLLLLLKVAAAEEPLAEQACHDLGVLLVADADGGEHLAELG